MEIEAQLIQCQWRYTDDKGEVQNRAIPDGAVRVAFQSSEDSIQLTVTDPAQVAALHAAWDPYKAGVDAAIKQEEDTAVPVAWPVAPRAKITVELVP